MNEIPEKDMSEIPGSLFYATAGRGTEDFAEEEIRSKLLAHIVSLSDEEPTKEGKIFFSLQDDTSYMLEEMLRLKSVERIFVAVSSYNNKEFLKGKRVFLNKLMSEFSCMQNYSFAQCVLKQLVSLACASGGSKSCVKPMAKKKRLHEETGNIVDNYSIVSKRVRLQEEAYFHSGTESVAESSSQDKSVAEINDSLDHQRNMYQSYNDFISFRLSIKCSGRIRKWLNIKKLSKDLSWRVSKATDWIVDLRKPDYEVCVHISDLYVTIGIPLTRLPLSRRKFLVDPGLRGPVAWIMTSLAEIKNGSFVLDPMCGKGTLLLESCSEVQEAIYIGVDNNCDQLESAVENAKQAGFQKHIYFLQGNALNLPLKCGAIDAVLCDAPFNQKYFTSLKADNFYFSFLLEMSRLLRMDGKLVLLTSQEFSELVIRFLQGTEESNDSERSSVQKSEISDLPSPWTDDHTCTYNSSLKMPLQLLLKHNVKLGETLATILVLKRIFLE